MTPEAQRTLGRVALTIAGRPADWDSGWQQSPRRPRFTALLRQRGPQSEFFPAGRPTHL